MHKLSRAKLTILSACMLLFGGCFGASSSNSEKCVFRLFYEKNYVEIGTQVNIATVWGKSPYTFEVSSGSGTVTDEGAFTASNTADVLITATDAEGCEAKLKLTGHETLAFDIHSVIAGGDVTLTATGGVSPYTFTISSGAGSIAGDVYSAPAAGNFGYATVVAEDAVGNQVSKNVYYPGNPIGWYRIDELSSLVQNDPVTTWTDYSGNGRDATQSTPALKPTMDLLTPGIGDRGGVKAVSSQSMEMPEFFSGDEITVAAAANMTTANDYIFGDTGTFGNEFILFGSYTGGALATFLSDAELELAFAIGANLSGYEFGIYSMHSKTTVPSQTVYRDGTSVATTSFVHPTFNTATVFNGAAGPPRLGPCNGCHINEVMYYDTVLSAANLKKVECYLGDKFGVTVSGC